MRHILIAVSSTLMAALVVLPVQSYPRTSSVPVVSQLSRNKSDEFASFQVIRINNKTYEATGIVSFTRAADMGMRVTPFVELADGSRFSAETAVRTRGQRRVSVVLQLPQGTRLNHIVNEWVE